MIAFWLATVALALCAIKVHFGLRINKERRVQGYWTRNGERL